MKAQFVVAGVAAAAAVVLAAVLRRRELRRAQAALERALTFVEHDVATDGPLPLPTAHPSDVGLSAG
jgi:hypothetical protein